MAKPAAVLFCSREKRSTGVFGLSFLHEFLGEYMKKGLTIALAGVIALSLLAGCGRTDTTSTGVKEETSSGAEKVDVSTEGEHELSVYIWEEQFNGPAMKAAEAAYQKKDPAFKLNIINVTQSADVEDAVTLAGSKGDVSALPDIILFQDHYIHQYVTNYPAVFVSADDADVNWDDFSAEKISFSTIDGTHYGFPVDNGTVVFAYRTDLLAKAGYTIDDVTGVTWADWLKIGKDVYDKTGKYLLAMDGDGNDLPYMMLQAEGTSLFKDGRPYFVNNAAMVQIMGVLKEAVASHALLLCEDWPDYTDNCIMGDQVAGIMNGNWILSTLEQLPENEGKWAITTLPTLSGKEGYASNGGSSLYITSACQKQDLAKVFLSYTFGGGAGVKETYDAALKEGGVISTWSHANDSNIYQEGVPYFNNQPVNAEIVEMGTHVQPVEQNDYYTPARKDLANALRNICGKNADIVTELQIAEDDINFQMGNN